MARGKQTCRILKEIRRQIAEANDIELATSECRYKGDCPGTCPKCEAEVRYLEQQLRRRQLMGKAVVLAGISAGAIAMLSPVALHSQTPETMSHTDDVAVHTSNETFILKGKVVYNDTLKDSTITTEPLIGALVKNLTKKSGVATDINGEFQIEAAVGDSIEISYIGLGTKAITIADRNPIFVALDTTGAELTEGIIIVRYPDNNLDLYLKDEHGNQLESRDITFEYLWIDEHGQEEFETLYPDPVIEDEKCIAYRLNWRYELTDEDRNPLKEATLRITAEGYENPVIIKAKYPKHNTKKTIKFKHKKSK